MKKRKRNRAKGESPHGAAQERVIAAFERAYLERVLREAGGNVTHAAEAAGLDRSNFRRLCARYLDGPQGDGTCPLCGHGGRA